MIMWMTERVNRARGRGGPGRPAGRGRGRGPSADCGSGTYQIMQCENPAALLGQVTVLQTRQQ